MVFHGFHPIFTNHLVNKMKTLCLFFAMLVAHLGFSQDTSCTFIIHLGNVAIDRYEYRFVTQTEYSNMPIETILSDAVKGLPIMGEHLESGMAKSGDKVQITTYLSDYCYPSKAVEKQLRIIVLRKKKCNGKIDFMYAESQLEAEKKVIIEINKFKCGKRKLDYYQYVERYHDSEGLDYGMEQTKELVATKIYIH